MKFRTAVFALMSMVVAPSMAMAATATSGAINSSAYNQVIVGSGSGGSSGTQTVKYEGPGGLPSGVTSMGAPYIMSANPCSLENGGSAVGGPFGLSVAVSKTEHGCVLVRDAGAMHSLGLQGASLAILCQGKDNAEGFFQEFGMLCPGTKNREDYKLEDLGIPGLKGTPVRAIIDPYTGRILNISQSPILAMFIKHTQPTNVVAMAPVGSDGKNQSSAESVANVWQHRMEAGSVPIPH